MEQIQAIATAGSHHTLTTADILFFIAAVAVIGFLIYHSHHQKGR